MDAALILLLLEQALLASTPVLLAAVGEIIAERSGVFNIGLEGLMMIGAFVAPLAVDVAERALGMGPAWAYPALGLLAAVAMGALVGLIYGYVAVYLRGDQLIAGVAINIFAAGLVAYGIEAVWKVAGYRMIPEAASVLLLIASSICIWSALWPN